MWRFAVGLALVGCGGGDSIIGTVTVSVWTDGGPGSELPATPMPRAGLAVFEEGGEPAFTDAEGNAVVSIMHDPATIHVVNAANSVTTVAGVPLDGAVRLGRASYTPSVGVFNVMVEDIGASSYRVGAPSCISFNSTVGARDFRGSIRGSCVGLTGRLVAIAETASGTQIAQKDVTLTANSNTMMNGFASAAPYVITLENAPSFDVEPSIKIGVTSGSGLVTMLPTLDGPAGIDYVSIVAGSSSLVVNQQLTPGATTLDASHLIPLPTVSSADPNHVAWTLASGASQPNLVEVVVSSPKRMWTIFGPASLESATFPTLPSGVTTAEPDAVSAAVTYYEVSRAVLTRDELNADWGGSDARVIARSRRAL
jgi:hypothetical protein